MDRGGYAYVSPEVNLNITLANWTTYRSVAIFRKTTNGIWKMEFNITGAMNNASRTSITLVTDVTFKTIPTSNNQCIFGNTGGAVITLGAVATANSITISHASAATTNYFIFGNLELETKPTAYLPDGV